MSHTSKYPAIIFRQRDASPVQVAFVASSADIDSWARVPTKRTGNIRNFQRAEIKNHVKEVTTFFKDDHNSSPTAVVVGFDPVRAEGRVEVRIADKRIEEKDVPPGTPRVGEIHIAWGASADPTSAEELRGSILSRRKLLVKILTAELQDITQLDSKDIAVLSSEFNQRALEGKAKLSDALDAAGTTDDAEEEEEEEPTGDDSAAEEAMSELSEKAKKVMAGLTPSERQVVIGRLEFLANVQEALMAVTPEPALRTLHEEIEDELKPALLIDGQHRVMGTKLLADIPFLVCALPHAHWPELAFQFIVTNRTARRVQESLLINIVGNSLSKPQRASIESRLRDAGIRVGLIEAIMKVNEDELSPFFRSLAFGIQNETGFIDAAAMRNKVVKLWYERNAPVRDLFDHFCEGKRARDKTDFWKSEELWFQFFIAFWSAVKERYEGSDVFSSALQDGKPVSRLMSATVLQIFQETVLRNLLKYVNDKLNKEEVTFKQSLKNEKAFTTLVSKALKPLTPEFFQGWQITGFDGSKGAKDDLAEAIELVLSDGKTIAELKSPKNAHRLFKKPA